MMQNLYSTILKNYTYDELKKLCLDPDFNLLFDCGWGIWRDKAQADFGVSPQFFDLIRTLSGPQRYLQIASYIKLSPLSEGVYEAVAGFREARYRKDKDMLLWFAQKIKPEQEEESRKVMPAYQDAFSEYNKLVSSWAEEVELVHPPQNGVYDIGYLCSAIKKRRVDILDQIIHRYFTLPEGFSIEKHVPRVPFWQIRDEEGRDCTIMHNLPLQNFSHENYVKLVCSMFIGGDVRIVDFFRSIFRDRNFNTTIKENYLSGSGFLFYHGRPEEAYGIDLRFLNKESYRGHCVCYDDMIESLLYALPFGDEKPEDYDFFTMRLGNLTYLRSLLSCVPQGKTRITHLLENQAFHVLYPLSVQLLQEYVDRAE
ncbi:Hypothetical protein ZAZAV_179 [Cedratvirus Zaza IHUMI]|uniref:Uncharacterized protein n=1 Tax=Cedratvirus Zaza IHUMI TaxID=2126979 RepID=A0A2R8FDZ0_9VIRU|nr:Hypothetical protein ZAZAV_179 [Cedratvirus Zaza IHUMI]